MSLGAERVLLLLRTTRNLRPAQVMHRVRLRAIRLPKSRPAAAWLIELGPATPPAGAGWPAGYVAIEDRLGVGWSGPEDNACGAFTFLNERRDLGDPPDWGAVGASRLWRFHLHYMEWAWSFASHADRGWAREAFERLWQSWVARVPFGHGDAWSPYVASLRAWALCGTFDRLVAGSGIEGEVGVSLRRHARFLRWHLEYDVGGNHLVKNLKALLGLGVFLGDDRLVAGACRRLERELGAQILSDGGHYERSPSYHCQVLADLIDIQRLAAAAGLPPVAGLSEAIEGMRGWLGAMLMPDGDVPLMNDCTAVGQDRLALLRPSGRPPQRLTVLAASGYVIVRPDDRIHLVADIGDPCPPQLPAHAHADCLSFELSVDGRRVVVDAGTSTYEPGPARAGERSTAAHNTVCVDGADQTEVWGTFRAARLARASIERADDDGAVITVAGSHDGYRRLPGAPVHRRVWSVTPGCIVVTDDILGAGFHRVASRLHMATEGALTVDWSSTGELAVLDEPASFATDFGRTHAGRVLTAWREGPLPCTIRTELRVVASGLAGTAGDHERTARGRA